MSTSIWFEPYLEKGPLQNLRLYRYSSVDLSPVTYYILRHWWDLAARAFPLWMAPNLITLAGLGFILLNVASLVVYIPDLIGPAPSWVYYSFALGLFLYQTFDNVDGRQARRTGTSSALGHIFDHTIDSLNCPLGGLIQVASVGLGSTKQGLFILLVGCGPMWFVRTRVTPFSMY
jgi:ethanolaminephosphotransferase